MEIFKLIYLKIKQLSTILHFGYIFDTIQNIVKVTIHVSSPDLNLVSGAGLHSHHTASSVNHLVTW